MATEALVGAAALSSALVTLWWSVAGDRRNRRRATSNLNAGLAGTTDMRALVLAAPASTRALLPLVARTLHRAAALTPASMASGLNNRILMAGMSSRWPVERTLAAKVLLGALGGVFGLLLLSSGSTVGLLYGVLLPVALFFTPDLILRSKAKARQKRIRVALPDTLDQVTVCVEAGLGFDAAIARAARTGDGPLAEELVRTLQDVQLGVPRKEALRRLADRSNVVELRQFVQAVIQAEGYGVPIARVLHVQASELREKRRQAAEERAMKISIKMLFPLVLCILPTVFIVILGPAIFMLVEGLSGANV